MNPVNVLGHFYTSTFRYFTTWGIQFFWPLDWRIAIQSIFVIDPIYTVPFLITLIVVLFLRRNNPKRKKINRISLVTSTSYLLITVALKVYIDQVFTNSLEKQKISYSRFETRPTPLNTILWTANVETNDAFYIGYYSFLDQSDVDFYKFPKNHELLNPYRNNNDIERLLFLTKSFSTLKQVESGIEMYGLRFGLTEGFDQGKGDFVFTYLIQEKNGELEITQKPNSFEGMRDLLPKLIERIGVTKSF